MKNVLFICSSIYQLIVIVQLKNQFYKDDCVDVILTSYMQSYKIIAKQLSKTKIFDKVITIDVQCLRKHTSLTRFHKFFCNIVPSVYAHFFIKTNKKYDTILLHSFNDTCSIISNILQKKTFYYKYGNPKLEVNLYEDGIATYSKLYEQYYDKLFVRHNSFINLYKKLLNEINLYSCSKNMFLFKPEYLTYTPKMNVSKIPAINNDDMVEILNQIFNYPKNNSFFDDIKLIYIEGFDGSYKDEQRILDNICSYFDKNRIIVKKHPRNKKFDFNNYHCIDSKYNYIPFELFLMNEDFSKKILISISSNSICSIVNVFEKDCNAIMLFDCIEEKDEITQYLEPVIRNIQKANPSTVKIPKDLVELKKTIQNLI